MTPEGRVKKRISELLRSYSHVYILMVVPGGYGDTTLDYICCFRGLFFSIEAKRPGKEPTNRQQQIRATMERAGGKVFKIDGDAGLAELKEWMDRVSCLFPSSSPTPDGLLAPPPIPPSST